MQVDFKKRLPQEVLAFLPLTLFFPVGFMYLGLLCFFVAFVISADFKHKWQLLRHHAMLVPTLALSLVCGFSLISNPPTDKEYWSHFFHYQTYWLLLPMIVVGAGVWQEKAVRNFFIGALIASTLFYAANWGLLPENTLFRSYIIYQGNKSILLGLLLAVASAWMLYDWSVHRTHFLWRLLAFVYVLSALILFSKSRTAALLFFLLLSVFLCRNFSFQRWQLALASVILACAGGGLYLAATAPKPVTCLAKEMQDIHRMNGLEIFKNRSICTVQQVRDFGKQGSVSEDGMRLEIYQNTWQLIEQRPLLGHGIGQWLNLYQEKARGMMSEKMTTPHNEYLLYWCELGVLGLFALLALWGRQLLLAFQMARRHSPWAMPLCLLTISMMFAGAFNAILRDALFGLAMMILLAIPLAADDRSQTQGN